jgi:hypothetical protein
MHGVIPFQGMFLSQRTGEECEGLRHISVAELNPVVVEVIDRALMSFGIQGAFPVLPSKR